MTAALSYLPEGTAGQCSHNVSVQSEPGQCPEFFLPGQVDCGQERETGVWVWGDFEMSSTGVTEWSLVCGDQWKVGLASSFYMIGLLVGSALVGLTSDREAVSLYASQPRVVIRDQHSLRVD